MPTARDRFAGTKVRLWHHISKFLKQIVRIARAGGCLGVILNGEDRQAAMANAFKRVIVEVDVRRFDVGGQCRGIDGKTVVLGGDLHLAAPLVAHRMIRASMAELELERGGSQRQTQQLMTQANAEDRHAAPFGAALDQLFQFGDRPFDRRRVSGTVRQEDPVGACSSTSSALLEPGRTVTTQPFSTK